MLRFLVSWPALATAAVVYWAILLVVLRMRARRQFELAYARAAHAKADTRVEVAIPFNASQVIAAILIGPVALALFRFVAMGSLR